MQLFFLFFVVFFCLLFLLFFFAQLLSAHLIGWLVLCKKKRQTIQLLKWTVCFWIYIHRYMHTYRQTDRKRERDLCVCLMLCYITYFTSTLLTVKLTSKLALQWLPCQAPGVIGSALGLVSPVSVYCDWVRWKVWSATSISVWQHVKLSEQMHPWDTLACCWDIKQPTNKHYSKTVKSRSHSQC